MDIELGIAKMLRVGVLLSGILMMIGWAARISFSDNIFTHFQVYHEKSLLLSLQSLFENRDWPLLLSYIGLGVLISLPILRVLLTLFMFLRDREYALAASAFLVLVGLAIGISLG